MNTTVRTSSVSGTAAAGTGGSTAFSNTNSERFTAAGGQWTGIKNVQSINLSNPKFNPIKTSDGSLSNSNEFFRFVFGVENDTQRYVFFLSESPSGIKYDISDPTSTSNRQLEMWDRELGSGNNYDKLTDDASDTTISLDTINNWHNGTRTIDLLNSSIYSDVKESRFNGVEALLNNSDGNATLFTFEMHGQVTVKLTEPDFPRGASAVSASNVNLNEQNVTFDLENAGSNDVTITGIAVNATPNMGSADRVGNGTNSTGTYTDTGAEFLDTKPLLDVESPLVYDTFSELDTNSTIPGGGTVTYKLGEFRDNGNNEISTSTPIRITLYFKNGDEKTFKLS